MWIFTTREVSVIIYSIVFLIYVLIKKGKSVFLPVIKAACHIKLIVPFIFIVTMAIIFVWICKLLPFWNWIYVKDITFWVLFVGIPTCFNSVANKLEDHYFRNILIDNFNSLLNLVTEEQRPLRVCMNNGKEFLLFPQDLLAPICDSDFRLILLSAMRYAMGRNTCMPMVVADYIKRHTQLLDDKFLVLAADEIRWHLEDYAEHEPNPNLWHDLLGALETEQRERATRKARKIRLCPACGKPLEVMSIADNQHSPGGFDVIAHCRNCLSDYEWFCDKDGGVSDMKQYFFG